MRFLTAIAIVALLTGCVTTEHAQTSTRQGVRAAMKTQWPKQQQLSARPLILGLAY
jgi:hypothetical protein